MYEDETRLGRYSFPDLTLSGLVSATSVTFGHLNVQQMSTQNDATGYWTSPVPVRYTEIHQGQGQSPRFECAH